MDRLRIEGWYAFERGLAPVLDPVTRHPGRRINTRGRGRRHRYTPAVRKEMDAGIEPMTVVLRKNR